MGTIGGQASGDFRQGTSALRILYSLIKDSIPSLAADGFTQSNPSVVVTPSAKSTTLPVSVKKGVLVVPWRSSVPISGQTRWAERPSLLQLTLRRPVPSVSSSTILWATRTRTPQVLRPVRLPSCVVVRAASSCTRHRSRRLLVAAWLVTPLPRIRLVIDSTRRQTVF